MSTDSISSFKTIGDITGFTKITSYDHVFSACKPMASSISLDIWLVISSLSLIKTDDALEYETLFSAVLDIMNCGFTVSAMFLTRLFNRADCIIKNKGTAIPLSDHSYAGHAYHVGGQSGHVLRRSARLDKIPTIIRDTMTSMNVDAMRGHGFAYHVKPEKYSWVTFRLPKRDSEGYHYFKCEMDDSDETMVSDVSIVDM
jgi:hypothetical protein